MEEEPKIVEEDIIEDFDPISPLTKYMMPHKPTFEVKKDLDNVKLHINMPLFPKNVSFEGEMLVKIPTLKLENWDLADRKKFLELVPSEYLEQVPYDAGIIKV